MRVDIGQLLADSFIVEAHLGTGAAATVWRVRARGSNEAFALKVLDRGRADDRERLLHEGAIQASIAHPHVVGLRERLDLDGWPALLLDLGEGGTLADLLARGSLSLPQVASLAQGLLDGVAAIHAAGVIHRDLKPENILLSIAGEELVPRISDFGIATRAGPSAPGGIGTPRYMAPEQSAGGVEADPRADLWSLGCLLYELCTGRRAFPEEEPYALLRSVARADYPAPSAVRADLPLAWERAISAALVADPALRVGKVEQLAALWGPALGAPAWTALPGRSSQPIPHNLPHATDPFVGRAAERGRLGQLLATRPLVTLRGAGGTGKTRLALRVAWEQLQSFPGGVSLCALAEARDPGGLCRAVGAALEVPLDRADPLEQLGDVLRDRGRCLLILDNFEQLGEAAAGIVDRWRAGAPEATFLVTSRVGLGLAAESLVALDPLPIPTDGVALFVARARIRRPGFSLSDGNREDVEAIVEALDGLPLAIELAAARVAVLSPARLRARLVDRFRLLRASEPTDPRQATLQAAIDWSWELLEGEDRRVLAALSVFEGGCTPAAIAAVAGPDAPDLGRSLVARSLAVEGSRLSLHRSIADYAAQKLGEVDAFPGAGPEGAAEVAARHGAFFSELGSPNALAALCGPQGISAIHALIPEVGNLLAAGWRAVGRGEGAVAAGCALAAWEVLELQGPFGLGVELLEAVAGMPGPWMGRILRTAGRGRWRLGQQEAAACHLEAALAATVDDPGERGEVHLELGINFWSAGRPAEAAPHFEQALAMALAQGRRASEAAARGSLANLAEEQGRQEEAHQGYEATLAIYRELGNRRREGVYLGNVGINRFRAGEPEAARSCLAGALEIAREAGDRLGEGRALGDLGRLAWSLGQMEEARARYGQALEIGREIGDRRSAGAALGNLGILHAMQGRPEASLHAFEGALAIHEQTGNRLSEGVVLGNLGILHRQEGRPDEARWALERALEIHRAVGNVAAEGSVLGDLGALLRDEGELEAARTACTAALALHRGAGQPRAEGVILGLLAGVELLDGRPEAARAALELGEARIRAAGAEALLADLWVVRARLELAQGDLAAAREALAEATRCAREIAAGPGSALWEEIEALRAQIDPLVLRKSPLN